MTCLNCESPVSKNFCSNCGQKTDIHRITFKHFITHDIIHGVWHFEKGIIFTIKQALLRPGISALEYISGKRIRYYNVFYIILLLIGFNIFLNHYHTELTNLYFKNLNNDRNNVYKPIDDFLANYSKLVIFSFVPLLAINSWIIFRRKKLNFSEHFIIAGMIFIGVMMITTIGSLVSFGDFFNYVDVFSYYFDKCIPIFIVIYISNSYYNCFKENYSKWGIFFRTLLKLIFFFIEIIIFTLLIIGIFTNWKFFVK